ncbi:MAG: Na/Pi cotransporter family protein [Ruminococcus sp.]
MELKDIFSLITGLALFLFGMSAMGDGMKSVAGNKLETILWKLSSTRLKGALLGTGVTAVIQSSSATSCMVVGFVNSGMMTIAQAISIIMGANIGTTATGWILSLSAVDGGGKAWWTAFLSTTFICAVFALIGILLHMLGKKPTVKSAGAIMLGFAVLMSGMKMMSSSMDGLQESQAFADMMTTFSNPIVGILAGTLITAILQSASASIGILQALSLTGAIDNSVAIPIIVGMCIGASMPVLLSAIGATTNGKRASIIYLLFNTIGAIVLTPIFYGLDAIFHFGFMSAPANAISIALINTIFNIAATILIFPFVDQFEKFVCFVVRDKKTNPTTDTLSRLDERFLKSPNVAIDQSKSVLIAMADKAMDNLKRSIAILTDYSDAEYQAVQESEESIDVYEDKLGSYLVKITGLSLNSEQAKEVTESLHIIGDFERIGDHAVNIADVAKEIHDKKLAFSDDAQSELSVLARAVEEIMELSLDAFENANYSSLMRVEPLEEIIDCLCDELKIRHIKRVREGDCTLHNGFAFSDLITNYERIADHCSNIAVALTELGDDAEKHAYLHDMKEHKSQEFIEHFNEYQGKYTLGTVAVQA